ncbi:MAG: hypothetical protein Q4F35_07375 [Akkermansia sp.]|nr:hypothetical protein [Akkermansia sp.]
MKKQFVKMAALAVMVLGVMGAQAAAASLSFNVNLANGKVNVGLVEHGCSGVHHKKVVKKKVVHHRHEMKKNHMRKHHHVAVRKDNRRGRR